MANIGRPRTPVGWWRLCLGGAAAALSLAVVLQPAPWKVFAEAGEKLRVVDFVVAYSWIAAVINIVLLAALAALCPWWARAPRPTPVSSAPRRGVAPPWFWPALLAALTAFTFLTVPRLTQSLWDDEETSLRFYVLGHYKRHKPEGEVRLKEVGWRETFFAYDTPNNHILHNVLARLSNSVWRAITKPRGLQFTEWALRVPAFLAGLSTLVVVALLLKDFGMPFAGVLTAWLLALHPWFDKYAAEARGYTMAMLFVCLALLFWRRALLSGSWLWWVLFALAQTLCLWTWPGALALFVLLNAGTIAVIARGRSVALPRRTVFSRWFCCNALAGIVLIQMMLPLIPQMEEYLAKTPKLNDGILWLANAGCYVATGAPWAAAQIKTPGRPEIRSASEEAPVLFASAMVIGTILLVWGTAKMTRSGKEVALVVVLSTAGALALQIWEIMAANMFVFAWYLIYLLPLITAAVAVGLSGFAESIRRMPLGKIGAPVAVSLVVALFVFVSQPARARGLTHSTEAVRESVLITRPDLDAGSLRNRETMTVGITDPPFCYDPELFWARSTRDLLLLCLQADALQRPLWLNLGYTWSIRELVPLTQKIVQDPTLFTDHQTFLSEFSHCDRLVCRYVPGGASKADLSQYLSPEDIRYIRENARISPEIYFAK